MVRRGEEFNRKRKKGRSSVRMERSRGRFCSKHGDSDDAVRRMALRYTDRVSSAATGFDELWSALTQRVLQMQPNTGP